MNYLLDLFSDYEEIFSSKSLEDIDFGEYSDFDMIINEDLDFVSDCS